MLRPLTRKDLPKYNKSGDSLHIPIVFMGVLRFVCDIHFGSNTLCYLEDGNGEPVSISDCELITDYKLYKKVISKLHPNPFEGAEIKSDRVIAFGYSLLAAQMLKNKTKQT